MPDNAIPPPRQEQPPFLSYPSYPSQPVPPAGIATQPYPDHGHPGQHGPQPKNGVGTAGFVLGLIGALFSLIPFIGVIAWLLVIPGLILALVGLARARSGVATNKGLCIAGVVLSVIGLLVCILYATLFGVALNNAKPGGVGLPPVSGSPSAPASSWGQTYTWADGVGVQVSAPRPFTPSASATDAGSARAVQFDVTVLNSGTSPYQFNEFSFGPTSMVDGQPTQSIIDFENKISFTPVTTILPGRSVTYPLALSVGAQPSTVQLEFNETITVPPAIFGGTG